MPLCFNILHSISDDFSVDFDEKLIEINKKLKAAQTRVSIARKGNRLWLRATLPPKPHINKTKPYQQEVSLKLKATPAGLQSAFIKAKSMGLELEQEKFDWYKWLDVEDKRGKISYWLEKFEDDYWGKVQKTDASLTTWKKDYQSVFNKLERDRDISLDYLIQVVRTTEPDSRSRLKACTYLSKLGAFAGIEVEKIKELKGKYSPSSVQPRSLPTDTLIAEYRESIKNEAWRWVFSAIAVYGLRNHEVFYLDLSEYPVARVLKGKTGERFIYPLYPEWGEMWNIENQNLPNIDLTFPSSKLGTKVSSWFRNQKCPFKAYDLRHCYARRCFQFGLAPDWAAGLMGHSISVHTSTYRAWIDEATYRKAYEAVINRENRPLPPI